jgi:hypothetical protein
MDLKAGENMRQTIIVVFLLGLGQLFMSLFKGSKPEANNEKKDLPIPLEEPFNSLEKDFIEHFDRVYYAFIKALIISIQAVWYTAIAPVLVAAFGAGVVLYAIFLAGAVAGETLMEVWDPKYHNSKPSEVFSIRQTPQDSPLPTRRDQSRIVMIENWSY